MKVTAATDTESDTLALSSMSKKKLKAKRNLKNQKGLLPLSSLASSLSPLALSYVCPELPYVADYLPGAGVQATFMFLIEDALCDPYVSWLLASCGVLYMAFQTALGPLS
jgi:hypothetical protein